MSFCFSWKASSLASLSLTFSLSFSAVWSEFSAGVGGVGVGGEVVGTSEVVVSGSVGTADCSATVLLLITSQVPLSRKIDTEAHDYYGLCETLSPDLSQDQTPDSPAILTFTGVAGESEERRAAGEMETMDWVYRCTRSHGYTFSISWIINKNYLLFFKYILYAYDADGREKDVESDFKHLLICCCE